MQYSRNALQGHSVADKVAVVGNGLCISPRV